MNVLLIGAGGREHALALALAKSPLLTNLWATPGNPGIAQVCATVRARLAGRGAGDDGGCFDIELADHDAVAAVCRNAAIGLVVIGPEAPLVDGLADSLRAAGITVFGPSAAAARLEGSKAFTKALCAAAGIPTAAHAHVRSRAEAEAALARFGAPVVVKADGLAAGKGVTVAMTRAEADAAVAALFANGAGEAVIEAYLDGEEASLFALTDGETVVALGSAQDHKRVGDGDTGPNTGGMGAYSPAAVLTPALEARAMREIVAPTVRALAAAGTPYSGVLYAGLMLTADGPQLIEYNVRFGDPEAQAILPRLEGDALALLLAVARGRLAEAAAPRLADAVALTVVIAAAGYPGAPRAGGTIAGIDAAEATGATVYQAGTALRDGTLVATGGRVLAVTALGPDVAQAQAAAYRAVDRIDFPDGVCRRDIGWRQIARDAAALCADKTGAD